MYLFNSEPFKNLKRIVNAISYEFVWIKRSTNSNGAFWVPEKNQGGFNYFNIKKIKSESKKSKQTFSFDVDIKVHRKGCETYWLTQKEKGLVIYLGGLVKGVLCRLFYSYGYKLEYVV